MKILFFILMFWSFFGFAGDSDEYSCEPVSKVDASDYKFDVIPIKRGDQKGIGLKQELDLSVYRGKIVLLSVFSPSCSWCLGDLFHYTRFRRENRFSDRVIMVNLSYGPLIRENLVGRLETTPVEMLHFVKVGYNKYVNKKVEKIDLIKNVDFYHIVDTQSESEPFFGFIVYLIKKMGFYHSVDTQSERTVFDFYKGVKIRG